MAINKLINSVVESSCHRTRDRSKTVLTTDIRGTWNTRLQKNTDC